jgi:chromatin segregation and condensation protein Rec8/ScpA/Scc1 (kleisin family)
VSLADLVGTFRVVLERYRFAHPAAIEIHHPRFSLREKMIELVRAVEERGTLPLVDLLGTFRYRREAITTFLAALELTRLAVLRLFQPAAFSEIHVSRTERPFDIAEIQDVYHD